MRLKFREFVLDTTARVLRRAQDEVAVEPQVFDCIALLAGRPGVLVRSAELRSRLWPDVHVAESAPRRVINEARRVLGDSGSAQSLIRTRKGLGYVFVAAVTVDHEASVAGGYDPLRTWPFVGRAHELDLLSRWVRRGSGGLCFVRGEAGAGKSSLLAHLAAQHAPRGVWLLGQCHAGPEQPALWPFREIARQLLAHRGLRSHALRLVRGQAGVLAAIPELALEDHAPPGERGTAEARFESYETWAGMLAALARVQPLQLVLEDMHWADEGSVWMLAALARVARSQRLHVLVTYRSEALAQARALGQLLARTSGREGVLDVSLGGLTQAALEALLEALEYPEATPRVASQLLQLTGGNALFVHELVRHALASSSRIGASLPASFDHIVAERTALVPERARSLLELAAVLGGELDSELLRAAASYPSPSALLSALEPALQAGLVRTVEEHPDRLMFSHALIRDALAAGLPAQRRQQHHLAVLCALRLQLPAASVAALASHAFEAGSAVPRQERQRLCEQAGRDALERLEFDRAALHLGRALSLLSADDSSADAAALTLLWARARWNADHPESEVGAALLSAAECARRARRPELLAQAAILYAAGDESMVDSRIVLLRPDAPALLEEAWQCSLRAVGGNEAKLSGEVAHGLATGLGWFRLESYDLAAMKRWAELALRLAPADPGPGRSARLLGLRIAADPATATEHLPELAAQLRVPGLSVRERIEGGVLLLFLYLRHAEPAQYERLVHEIELLARPLADAVRVGRVGDRLSTYVGIPLLARITLRVIRGQFAEAAQALAALPGDLDRLGLARMRRVDVNTFALGRWLAAYRGQSGVLEPLVDLQLRADPGLRWLGVFWKLRFALERGTLQEAREHYSELRASDFQPLVRGQQLPAKASTLLEIGDACTHVGTTADAALLYERLSQRAGLAVGDGVAISWGACDRVLGMLAMQLGRYVEAEQHFQRALALNTRLGHRPELVRTQLGLARLCSLTDRAQQAERLGSSARAAGVAMGMAGFALELPV